MRGMIRSAIVNPSAPLQIEFSDDMFLIPKEDAEREIGRKSKDNRIARLVIETPAQKVAAGQRYRFIARAYNKDGEEVTGKEITWHTDGGEISDLGEFCAGETPGTYCVTAVCDNVPAEVQIQVKKEVTRPKPEIQTKITSLHWDGKVDPFKWSNFYNRLIIKLMKSGKLDLSINLSVNNRDGISQEMVDEIRVALKELELDEDIQMNKSVYDY